MKKRKVWPIVLSVVVLGLVGGIGYLALTTDNTPEYSTVSVKNQTLEVSVAANGQLVDEFNYSFAAGVDPVVSQAPTSSLPTQPLASLPGYTVKKVLVAPGERVEKGQVLLRLENPLEERETIKAPADGVIRTIKAIEETAASGELLTMGSGRLLASVQVSEYDIAELSIDQTSRVNIDALSQEYEAKVSFIGQLADSSTGVKRYTVLLELTGLPETARLGMSANAKIITLSLPNALSIPANAVANIDGKNVVAKLGSEGEVIPLEVTVGVVGDTLVEIKSGLSANDVIVVGQIGDIPEVNASFGPPPGVRSNNTGN